MKALLIPALLLACLPACAATQPCHDVARAQARKLLAFHTDGDDRAQLGYSVKTLPPLSNPANKGQKLLVLELTGQVYKAEYRIRMIYFPLDRQCVLMGQEIIELSSL